MRSSALAALAALAVLAPLAAGAQVAVGTYSAAAHLATADAAALGAPPGALGVHTAGGRDFFVSAGGGLRGGSLRLALGGGGDRLSGEVGYARPVVAARPGRGAGAATVVLGAEARAGYTRVTGRQVAGAAGARIALPLGVRWGSASGLAITPYLAPYAALERPTGAAARAAPGAGAAPGASATADLGAGVRLAFGRAGLELGVRDLAGRHATLGVTISTRGPERRP